MLLNEEYTQQEVQEIFEDMLWQFADYEYELDFDRNSINPKLGWLSKHNRKTLGRCHYDGYEYDILLNPNMLNFEENGINTIKNTLAHELCHTLPGCMNHGKNFHDKAKMINDLMGYIIDTKADVDSSSYFRKYLPNPNYKTVCGNCGYTTPRPHICNEVRNPGAYICYKCGSQAISSYKLNKQTGEYELFKGPEDELEYKYKYICPDCGWKGNRKTRNKKFKWHETLLQSGHWLACPKCGSHDVYILDDGEEIHTKKFPSSYSFIDDDEEEYA